MHSGLDRAKDSLTSKESGIDSDVQSSLDFLKTLSGKEEIGRYILGEFGVRSINAALSFVKANPFGDFNQELSPETLMTDLYDSTRHPAERLLTALCVNLLLSRGTLTDEQISQLESNITSKDRERGYLTGIALYGLLDETLVARHVSMLSNPAIPFSVAIKSLYALKGMRDPESGKISQIVINELAKISESQNISDVIKEEINTILELEGDLDTLADFYSYLLIEEAKLFPSCADIEKVRLSESALGKLAVEVGKDLLKRFGLSACECAGALIRELHPKGSNEIGEYIEQKALDDSWSSQYLEALRINIEGDALALDSYLDLLKRGSNYEKALAAVVLWRCPDKECLKTFCELVKSNDTDGRTRVVAAYILGGSRDDECIAQIEALEGNHPEIGKFLRKVYLRGGSRSAPEELFVQVSTIGDLF